jgi:glycerol-3-phosphate acyltransferase PlsY
MARYVLDGNVAEILAGLAAVAGHDWPIFLRFRGGKGVATSVGGLFVMAPVAAASGIAIFAVVSAVSRYVSLGSLIGSLSCLAIVGGLTAADKVIWQYLVYTAGVVVLIIIRHRDNIARLLSGTENKIGQSVEKR